MRWLTRIGIGIVSTLVARDLERLGWPSRSAPRGLAPRLRVP
jgi:hypothetical protein